MPGWRQIARAMPIGIFLYAALVTEDGGLADPATSRRLPLPYEAADHRKVLIDRVGGAPAPTNLTKTSRRRRCVPARSMRRSDKAIQ